MKIRSRIAKWGLPRFFRDKSPLNGWTAVGFVITALPGLIGLAVVASGSKNIFLLILGFVWIVVSLQIGLYTGSVVEHWAEHEEMHDSELNYVRSLRPFRADEVPDYAVKIYEIVMKNPRFEDYSLSNVYAVIGTTMSNHRFHPGTDFVTAIQTQMEIFAQAE